MCNHKRGHTSWHSCSFPLGVPTARELGGWMQPLLPIGPGTPRRLCFPGALWKWEVTCESAVFFTWENTKQSLSGDGPLSVTQLSLCVRSCSSCRAQRWHTHTHIQHCTLWLNIWQCRAYSKETAIPLSLHGDSFGRYGNKYPHL